ncbi:MAG: histidinol dehydrogenase, partial [Actinomycetota bacterium]
MTSVLRSMEWATMTPSDRRRFCDRTLANVIPATLRDEIAKLIDDVRERGDDAVVDATRHFDGVALSPAELRVTEA